MSKKNKCGKCGKIIKKEVDVCRPDMYDYVEEYGYDILCSNCWDKINDWEENKQECCLCERVEHIQKSGYWNYFILFEEDAKLQGLEAGFYEILEYPFYDDDCISQIIRKYNVKKIFDLKGQKKEDFDDNRICSLKCIKNLIKNRSLKT